MTKRCSAISSGGSHLVLPLLITMLIHWTSRMISLPKCLVKLQLLEHPGQLKSFFLNQSNKNVRFPSTGYAKSNFWTFLTFLWNRIFVFFTFFFHMLLHFSILCIDSFPSPVFYQLCDQCMLQYECRKLSDYRNSFIQGRVARKFPNFQRWGDREALKRTKSFSRNHWVNQKLVGCVWTSTKLLKEMFTRNFSKRKSLWIKLCSQENLPGIHEVWGFHSFCDPPTRELRYRLFQRPFLV